MGWCSGTEIFDAVAEEVLQLPIEDSYAEEILSKLYAALRDQDWDCESDSIYYDLPLLRRIRHKILPDRYDENGDYIE